MTHYTESHSPAQADRLILSQTTDLDPAGPSAILPTGAPMNLAMALFVLGLALLFGYFGFIRPDGMAGVNTRNRFASVALTVLALLFLYNAYQNSRVPEEIGKYITPYPGASGSHLPASEGDLQVYRLRTDDPPADVLAFYRDMENHRDWVTMEGVSRGIEFQRDDMSLLILPTRSGGETKIAYFISRRKE